MIEFKGLWGLKVRHDYFENGACTWGSFDLSRETQMMMYRRGCMWQEVSMSEWRLVSFSADDQVFNSDDTLELDYSVAFKDLYYNTELPWRRAGHCPQIRIDTSKDMVINMDKLPGELVPSNEGIEFKLILPLQGLNSNHMTFTEIQYRTSEHYLDYYFVPRDGNLKRKLEVVATNSNLTFQEVGDTVYDIFDPCLHFRSNEMMRLKSKTRIQAALYEILDNGIRKPLIRELPTPVMGVLPIDLEAASAIVYF